jgi:hypothetical protein
MWLGNSVQLWLERDDIIKGEARTNELSFYEIICSWQLTKEDNFQEVLGHQFFTNLSAT